MPATTVPTKGEAKAQLPDGNYDLTIVDVEDKPGLPAEEAKQEWQTKDQWAIAIEVPEGKSRAKIKPAADQSFRLTHYVNQKFSIAGKYPASGIVTLMSKILDSGTFNDVTKFFLQVGSFDPNVVIGLKFKGQVGKKEGSDYAKLLNSWSEDDYEALNQTAVHAYLKTTYPTEYAAIFPTGPRDRKDLPF